MGKEPEPEPAPEPDTPEPEEPERPSLIGPVVVLLVMVLAGAGAICYLRLFKKKPDVAGSADLDDYDYGGEDEPEDETWEDEASEDGSE